MLVCPAQCQSSGATWSSCISVSCTNSAGGAVKLPLSLTKVAVQMKQ